MLSCDPYIRYSAIRRVSGISGCMFTLEKVCTPFVLYLSHSALVVCTFLCTFTLEKALKPRYSNALPMSATGVFKGSNRC